MLDEMIGQRVVVDLSSQFVCMGTLSRADNLYLELHDADLHDLRGTRTTRENYVAAALATGVKRNRKRVLLVRAEVVAIACVNEVVGESLSQTSISFTSFLGCVRPGLFSWPKPPPRHRLGQH